MHRVEVAELVQYIKYHDKDMSAHLKELIQNACVLIEALDDANQHMQKDVEFLRCLKAAGVDNWDWCDVAREMMGADIADTATEAPEGGD